MEQHNPDALVTYTTEHGTATITLNSDANRNALSTQLMRQLLDHLDTACTDDAIRTIVLTHTGRVFCSGADLKETAAAREAGEVPAALLTDVLAAIWEHPKPIIAKIHGPARAGGLGLIAACDIAVCSTDATFAFTEVRIGVIPAVISATVLRRITPRDAADLYLTGDVFDGNRAATIGLVTQAVPADNVDATVHAYTTSIAKGAPKALAGAKTLLRRGEPTLTTELSQLSAISAEYFLSDEGREGVLAYREKREPAWIPHT